MRDSHGIYDAAKALKLRSRSAESPRQLRKMILGFYQRSLILRGRKGSQATTSRINFSPFRVKFFCFLVLQRGLSVDCESEELGEIYRENSRQQLSKHSHAPDDFDESSSLIGVKNILFAIHDMRTI